MRRRHVLTLAAAGAVTAGCGPGGPPRRRESAAPAAAAGPGVPEGVRVGRVHIGVPDRGRRDGGRPRTVGLGRVQPQAGHTPATATPATWPPTTTTATPRTSTSCATSGLRSYRFSISWPRVMPTGRGTVNQPGPRLLPPARRRPARPRHHPDGHPVPLGPPQALQDAGGWEHRDTRRPGSPTTPTRRLDALGDKVPTWLTINEPKTVVEVGYPPASTRPGSATPASPTSSATTCCSAHGLAVQAYGPPAATAGSAPALNLSPVLPRRRRPTRPAAGRARRRLREPALPRPGAARRVPGRRARRRSPRTPRSAPAIRGRGPGRHRPRGATCSRVQYYTPALRDGQRQHGSPRCPTSRGVLAADLPRGHLRPPDPGHARLRRHPDHDHRERPALADSSTDGTVDDPDRIAVPARPPRRRPPGHRRRRAAGELPRVVAAGQLRVGRGLRRSAGA